MVLLINNQAVKNGDVTSFRQFSELNISCSAINSRPLVSIKVLDTSNNVFIPAIPSRGSVRNPLVVNSGDDIYQITLRVSLTPGFAAFNNIKRIVCIAENTTEPYQLANTIGVSLDFNS